MGLCFSSSLNRWQYSGSAGSDSKNVGKSQLLEIASGSIDGEGSSLRRPLPLPLPYPDGGILKWPNLKVFSFKELRSATKDFRPETLVGELGFSTVYKGWLDEDTLIPTKAGSGMVVAIRMFNPRGYPGFQEWQLEVNFLGRLSHPNLVKLFGYCWDDDKILLVYEFMPKGNLDRLLFRRNPDIELLSWNTRLKIAIDAARGLAFLHTPETKVIFRAFKASNILLDGNYNAKISGFGLARLGPSGKNSHVSTNITCTGGYSAPEYNTTGHLYVKSDVYGFGVVLLEILTGMRVFDRNRPNGQQDLVKWTRPYLSSKKKLKTIMDANIKGQYSPKAALQAAKLTLECLAVDYKLRPSMKDVLAALEAIEAIQNP